MVAAAIVGSAVVGAGASIASGNKASKTAKQTAQANNQLDQQIYNSNKAELQPYVNSGNAATSSIDSLLGLSGNSASATAAYNQWKNATGYSSALKQGQDSVTAALGAKGLTDSGAAMKALTQYGQDFANQNFETYLGNLQTQQQTGLAGASALAGVGENYATSVTNNNNVAANASENASLNTGNAINSALGNVLSAYTFNQALGSSYGASGKNAYGLTSGNIY